MIALTLGILIGGVIFGVLGYCQGYSHAQDAMKPDYRQRLRDTFLGKSRL